MVNYMILHPSSSDITKTQNRSKWTDDRRSTTPCRQGSKYVSANIRRLSEKVGYKVYHLKRKMRERISTCLQAKFICSLDRVQNFTQQSETCFLQLALQN